MDTPLSCICVKWKTKGPNIGEWRRTPFFCLRENELCLELALDWDPRKPSSSVVGTRIVWRCKPPDIDFFESRCFVQVGSQCFFEESARRNYSNYSSLYGLVDKILTKSAEISTSPSAEAAAEWSVVCQLSIGERFCSQVEKNIIHLSTVDDSILPARVVDKYVQVSSAILQGIEALSCDFSRMLNEKILPDFTLMCGGRNFPVHKTILAARSKVFQAMFRNDMMESKTGSVDIKDLQAPILDLLLKFMYSGKLEDVTVDTAANLYEAADKYAMHSLMTACSHYIIRNVTVENCLGYLKTADMHSDPDLKTAVALFVSQNPKVFKSAAWKTFSVEHPLLAKEVLQNYVSSINP